MPPRIVEQVRTDRAYVVVVQAPLRSAVSRAAREIPLMGRVCDTRPPHLESNGEVWRGAAQFVPYRSWVQRGGEVRELRARLRRQTPEALLAVTVVELEPEAARYCETAIWMRNAERSAENRLNAITGAANNVIDGATEAIDGAGEGAGNLLKLTGTAIQLLPVALILVGGAWLYRTTTD